MAAPRRKLTYGKRANNSHNFFGQWQETPQPVRIDTPSPTLDTDSTVGTRTPDHDDINMFDPPSSDDEIRSSQSAPKRRKLTPTAHDGLQQTKAAKPRNKAASTSPVRSDYAQQAARIASPRKKVADITSSTHQATRVTKKKTYGRNVGVSPAKIALRSPSISPASRSSRSPSVQPLTPTKPMAAIDEMAVFSAPSTISIPTPEGTPHQHARLQNILNDGNIVDSPSKLGLGRLNLKSQPPSSDQNSSNDESIQDTRRGVRRVSKSAVPRRRLIDALGPSPNLESSSLTIDDEDDDETHREEQPKFSRSSYSGVRTFKPPGSEKDSVTVSSQPLTSGGPKMTYAKQRSYLSESMVDEIPAVSAIGSSQTTRPSTISKVDSFDMDLDDEGGSSGIRSVHELKKAGQAARAQETLDAIFEDITSNTKSRRILGYTQLCSKLSDSASRTHFIAHAMSERLLKCSISGDNILEATLHCTASAFILYDGQASSRTIQSVATLIPQLTSVLGDERSLDKVGADRRQNLSKASRKDLASFQEEIQKSDLWDSDGRPTVLTPQLLGIRLIEILLRRGREKNDYSLRIPLVILESLVTLLFYNAGPMALDVNRICRLQLIVSILESYTLKTSALDASHMRVLSKLSNLGPILEELSLPSFLGSRQTQHLVLRLILNITNNNTTLCDAFAQPALLTAVLKITIAESRHLDPSAGSDAGLAESVLLSLGLAINLAEMSEKCRRLMASVPYPPAFDDKSSVTCLDQLLEIFLAMNRSENSEFGDVDRTDPTVVGEGHNLVAFGYLSVLLSVLCADPETLNVIARSLPGGNIGALKTAMRVFIAHFRTMEQQLSGGEYIEMIRRWEGVLKRLEVAAFAADLI